MDSFTHKKQTSKNVMDTTLKKMTPHIFLNFYKFFRVVYHFSVNSVLSFSALWLFLTFFDYFFQLIYFHDGFHEGYKRKKVWTSWELHKHNTWKVIKDDLVLKMLYYQPRENQKWHSVVIIEEYEDFFEVLNYCTP